MSDDLEIRRITEYLQRSIAERLQPLVKTRLTESAKRSAIAIVESAIADWERMAGVERAMPIGFLRTICSTFPADWLQLPADQLVYYDALRVDAATKSGDPSSLLIGVSLDRPRLEPFALAVPPVAPRVAPSSAPTSEQCSKEEPIAEAERARTYAFWHPQWGGYVSKATVRIGKHALDEPPSAPGAAGGFDCFEVEVWHDGEFPRDEAPQRFHYCDPIQLVEMGLFVAEKQVACGMKLDERAIADLEEVIARARALLGPSA